MKGLHSPFGHIWQVATSTGWTMKHILWRVPWPALQLMIADAPRYVSGKGKDEAREIASEEEAYRFFGVK